MDFLSFTPDKAAVGIQFTPQSSQKFTPDSLQKPAAAAVAAAAAKNNNIIINTTIPYINYQEFQMLCSDYNMKQGLMKNAHTISQNFDENKDTALYVSTQVYPSVDDQSVMKCISFSYNSRKLDSITRYFRKIENEITLQSAAAAAAAAAEAEALNFFVPNITEYGYTIGGSDGSQITIFIVMDMIHGYPVQPSRKTCRVIRDRVIAIDSYLKKNSIYHNDLNQGNVYIVKKDEEKNEPYSETDTIAILDFGEATNVVSKVRDNIFMCI